MSNFRRLAVLFPALMLATIPSMADMENIRYVPRQGKWTGAVTVGSFFFNVKNHPNRIKKTNRQKLSKRARIKRRKQQ